MSNANNAWALVRGEIDANQYWCESGKQQVESAGVLLTEQQQNRVIKNLARLAGSLRGVGFGPTPDKSGDAAYEDDELTDGFAKSLRTYLANRT